MLLKYTIIIDLQKSSRVETHEIGAILSSDSTGRLRYIMHSDFSQKHKIGSIDAHLQQLT